jgi:hypothetical protein
MRCRIATTPTPLIPCRAIRQGNIEFAKSILSNDFRARRTAIERSEREFTATPPLSADRTGSPAAVSGKREYLKELPETFDNFSL